MRIDMGMESVANWMEKNFGWILVGAILLAAFWGISVAVVLTRIFAKFGIQ